MKQYSTLNLFDESNSIDFQTCIMFALRYSYGRRTYAFALVVDFILANYKSFQSWRLKQMAEDIESDAELFNLSGWEMADYRRRAALIREAALLKEQEENDVDIERPAQ